MRKQAGTNPDDLSGKTAALRIVAVYVLVGALWILGSDRLVEWLAPDRAILGVLQTIKGWLYVTGTGLLLWFLVRRHALRLGESAQALASQHRRLLRAHRALKALSGCNQAITRTQDEQDLLQRICDSLVGPCGYRFASVTLKESGGEGGPGTTAYAGHRPDDGLHPGRHRDESPESGERPGIESAASKDGVGHAPAVPGDGSRTRASARGSEGASLVLPLVAQDRALGALAIDAPEHDAFDDEEERLLAEVADDLAFAVAGLRLRRAHQKSLVALAESEQRIKTLFETMPLGIVYHDADGRVMAANPAAEEILGVTSGALLGRAALDSDVPAEAQPANMALATGKPVGGVVMSVHNPAENQRRWILVAAVPQVRVGEEKPWQVYTTLQDITHRREAEQERSHLEAQLRQSQKLEAIGRLAGGVAHDFNNMLSIVIGRAELALLRIENDAPLREDLAEIWRAAEHGADLTRQLLAFARQQAVAPRVLDLNRVIEQTKGMLMRLIGEDVSLTFASGRNLWTVRMDPSQVDQVLANLAVNARDAIDGVGTLVIETANVRLDASHRDQNAHERPGDYAMITVTDSGCGMDQEVLAHVFEPFFTTKSEGQGTGLGLSTVFGIIRQNEGFIELDSELGKGTTFRIYIPRARQGTEPLAIHSAPVRASVLSRPASADAAGRDTTRETAGARFRRHTDFGNPTQGSETIMIVEDEEHILRLCGAALESRGYRVVMANGPEQALDLCHGYDDAIDLLVTDVVMPSMNGRELKERIEALKPGIRTLFMSGYTADIIANRGVLSDGTRYIQKPFGVNDFAVRVRSVLDE